MITKSKNILLVLSSISFLLTIDAMDPEIQLCQDLTIDAAVVADDHTGYAFKGQFYWQMSTTFGISPNFVARYISDRWKGLTGPIDAAFTIDDTNYRFCTVFIKGKQWFLYQMENLKAKGNTINWPFKRGKVLSAFEIYNKTLERKDFAVYLLKNNDTFSKFRFRDIERPTHLISGKTYRKGVFLFFIYNPSDDQPGTLLSEILEPRAVISDDKGFVIFGVGEYCITETDEIPICKKTTDKEVVGRYFGCPREPFPTTTTTTTSTTTMAPTTNTTTATTTIPNTTTRTTTSYSPETNLSITESTIIESSKPSPQTGVKEYEEPTDGSDLRPKTEKENTREESKTNSFLTESMDSTIGDGEDDFKNLVNTSVVGAKESTDKKSKTGVIILVIVIFVIICVIIFSVILFFTRNSNKKSKKGGDKEKGRTHNENQPLNPILSSQSNNKDNNKTIANYETNPGLQTASTASVRSDSGSESDEKLGKHLKDDKPSAKPSDANKSTASGTDQKIDAIKSEEDI